MRNVSDRSCRENQNAHFFKSRASYRILWENTVEPDRPQMTIRRMRIACCTPTATNALWEYVTLTAFPLQQWLHERASLLRYKYNASLVVYRYVLVYFYIVGVFSFGIPSLKWLQCCCVWLWDKCSVLDPFPLQLAALFIPCELTRN
jgi:hypothetical protein